MSIVRRIAITILVLLQACLLHAQKRAARAYTSEHPLVYEDVRDLPPYSFTSDNGVAEGFNIELVRLMLHELGIPYRIQLSNRQEAYNDLKAGKSDLIIGLSAGFHDQYGHYSTNSITLFTQSVVSPKQSPSTIRNFNDLKVHQVFVNDSSLCHHLMLDLGWGDNAIPTKDVVATLLQMSTEEKGELVWNTLSLKWLLHKYQIDNLVLQPINMPHGEYKFMSNDDRLLAQLDSIYAVLNSADRITPLNNKWFYPERQEKKIPGWVWYAGGSLIVLLLIMLIYTVSYRVEASRIAAENKKRNRRLSLILETSNVRVWTYDIAARQFTWRDEAGQPAFVYEEADFAQRYEPQDYERLSEAIRQLAGSKLPKNSTGEEDEVTLDIKAKDAREDGDEEMHDFIITLSVLRRDKNGTPRILIGTKKDVTKKRELERKAEERSLRYWAIFNTPIVGILLFDQDGRLKNLNMKACSMFGCDRDEILAEQPCLNDFFDIGLEPENADGFYATQIVPFDRLSWEERRVKAVKRTEKLYNEYKLVTIYDEEGLLMGVFAFCTDVAFRVKSIEEEIEGEKLVDTLKAKEREYVETIDDFIRNGDSRMVSYSPVSHVFTIYKTTQQVQHVLTPTRLITLVDNRMRTKAMHIINHMDARENKPVDTDICTTLRRRDQKTLYLHLHVLPQLDKDGNVYDYLGILTDISELKETERLLDKAKAKTQEVEDTKSTFIKNMMQEIQTPLSKVLEKAGELTGEDSDAQQYIRSEIVDNAEQLTHIINNVLYLSRLEAHMVEIKTRPTDFALIFEEACRSGWEKHLQPNVKCVVENPYDKLVIDIDKEHLTDIIKQLTCNSAQFTHSGVIHTRYDYIGRRLMISIDDTGEGIDQRALQQLDDECNSGIHTSCGMGLPICKELTRQMGGHLEINSEPGLGTTVWVTLPCHALAMKKKKLL